MSRDWMFCPLTGALLDLEPSKGLARCPISGYTKSLADLKDVKLVTVCDMEDYRRRFNLEPLVKTQQQEEEAHQIRKRATIDEVCTNCGHEGLEFYTMQLRSADEGQTVFYECPACGDRTRQNN